ncbi:MAG: hypothetical protein F4152_02975, partial [Dehalococcoidia bacterium]|nr:hypothetical protein [Dehalococcoidia bacterium]
MRNGFIWLLVVVAAIAIGVAFLRGGDSKEEVPFGQIVQDIKQGRINTLEVDGRDITAIYHQQVQGQPLQRTSKVAENTDIATFLRSEGIALSSTGTQANAVNLEFKDGGGLGPWLGLLLNLFPFLLFGAFLLLIMR